MIPEVIKIKDIDYKINMIKEKIDVNAAKDCVLHGSIDPEIGEIRLWDNPNKNIINHVLFHEIAHGLMHSVNEMDKYHDETFVDNLASALHSLLRDNDLRFVYEEKK